MDRVQKTVNTDMQSVSPQMMIVQGVVQNLPEIVGAIKEIYRLNKKGEAFSQVLQSRLDELNINRENFNVLVVSLTELSKTKNPDEETKAMYRDMIKTLFEIFTNNMRSSQDVSNYLNEF
jgi:ubiquinone/menaquinone biosynthesis C-methylase UbiE